MQSQRQDRERYELQPELACVQRQVLQSDSRRISFLREPRSVLKFGENLDLGADVQEMVWETGGIETLLTGNTITRVSSSNVADVGVLFTLEGHTIDGDGNLTRVVQDVILNGQAPQTLPTPLARAERSYTANGISHLGNVFVYDTTATVTAGVPDTGIHIQQRATDQQSQKAAISVPHDSYAAVTALQCSIGRTTPSAGRVTFQFFYREQDGIFRNVFEIGTTTEAGPFEMDLSSPIVLRPNSDFQVRAVASVNNVRAKATFVAYFAKVYE